MKSALGVPLNNILMVGPTVHLQLVDVLICFLMHHIVLVADASKLYHGVEILPAYHNFQR